MKRSKCAVFVVLAGVFLCAGVRPAGAERTWYVDDDAPADFNTIQAAIDAASDGDTIIVRNGLYTGDGNRDIDFKGKAVHLRSENGPENCVVDAQGSYDERHRAFHFRSGETRDAIVEGFTITGGYAPHTDDHDLGGAVYCVYGASPTITGNIITGNFARRAGGGIGCWKGAGPLIADNIIEGNSTDSSDGGGIAIYYSPAVVVGNVISNNNSRNGFGGGIYCYGLAVVSGNVVVDNAASRYGGGISAWGDSITITDNVVSGNSAGGSGGGIHLNDASATSIANNIVSQNQAVGDGGGILSNYSDVVITNNVIVQNTAEDGGGLTVFIGTPIIRNNTIAFNSATKQGGGLKCRGNVFMTNTIVRGNSAPRGADISMNNSLTVAYSCTVAPDGISKSLSEGSGTVIWGEGNIEADPMFVDPNPAEGVGDYRLMPGSPCIDSGDPEFVPETNETDADGGSRVVGSGVDIGAYEFHGDFYISTDAPTSGQDGSEENPFGTIQAAIDAAESGDTVVIFDGTYTGPGNRDIDFRGKAITLTSMHGPDLCIVDCEGTAGQPHRGFHFNGGEGPDTVLSGLAITGGHAPGGAILCESSPLIRHCVFRGNVSEDLGGGVLVRAGSPTFTRCTFAGNTAVSGAGFASDNALPSIENCLFAGNDASDAGGGIYWAGGTTASIINVTIAHNRAARGGAIAAEQCSAAVRNSILWGNSAANGPEIALLTAGASSALQVEYSDVAGGQATLYGGDGWAVSWADNIDVDPDFQQPGSWDGNVFAMGDYRRQPWSLCTDAGEPGYVPAPGVRDLDGLPRVRGAAVDMGAYETQLRYWFVDDDAPNDPMPNFPDVSDPAEDGSPLHPFDAIQEGIDAAEEGGVVMVLDGTYTGDGNRDIDLNGKAITVRSQNGPENCRIYPSGDISDSHTGFSLADNVNNNSIIDGFTIQYAYSYGIYCPRKSVARPTIRNNIISDNEGGGIRCERSGAIITNNIVRNNTGKYGAGIYCKQGTVTHNTVVDNVAHDPRWNDAYGGGIVASGVITHNTVVGNSADEQGGGMRLLEGDSEVMHNQIIGNHVEGYGGGISMARYGMSGDVSATVSHNVITDNSAGIYGGGIYAPSGSVIESSYNVIAANEARSGGGMYVYSSGSTSKASPKLMHDVIAGNTATEVGGGLFIAGGRLPTIANSILWANDAPEGPQIRLASYGIAISLSVSYCDVEGGSDGVFTVGDEAALDWGEGNIDVDPLFADPDGRDYHLKSQYGRWDPAANDGAGGWVVDDVTSPCIDAGNPGYTFWNEPPPNGARINMGAYGNTAEASKSPPQSAYTLEVASVPFSDVAIGGTHPGTTNYAVESAANEEVTLLAPSSIAVGDSEYAFIRWVVDGEPEPSEENQLRFTVVSAHTAAAVYEAPGDLYVDDDGPFDAAPG